MTHLTSESRNTSQSLRTASPSGASQLPDQRIRRARAARSADPAAILVAGCVAVHLLAAAVVYHDVVRDLYALFDANPRLLVLEHGLVRLTAVSVFLPPLVPAALLAGTALWLGQARRMPGVARWLAFGALPLAADGVLRAIGVVIAPAPSSISELLDLPSRFSLGPRLVLDLAGVRPPASVAYWVVICTAAAAISAWCVARALLAAERAPDDARHTHRRGTSTMAALQVGVATAGAWIALAFAGQVALPWATHLFLRAFG